MEGVEKNETISIKSNESRPRIKLRRVVSESDLMKSRQIPVIIQPLQIERMSGTPEMNRMSGPASVILSMTSEGADPPFGDIHVKEEPIDEFDQDNLQIETSAMEEDSEIDIKEEDVGYGQSIPKQDCDNSTHNRIPVDPLNTDQSSDTPIKHEIDRNIQRNLFRSADRVSNIEPVSGHCGPEVGNDSERNRISSHLTKKSIRPKWVKPLPQVTQPGLRGQKEKQPPLTTRPAKEIQCKDCCATFDSSYKLKVHNQSDKCNAPFDCPTCRNSYQTIRVFTNHLKTHTGEKKKESMPVRIYNDLPANRQRSLSVENKKVRPRGRPKKKRIVEESVPVMKKVDDTGFSAKRSLPVEGEKANPGEQPQKQRKVVCETKVRDDEEIPRVRDGIDPPRVVEGERNDEEMPGVRDGIDPPRVVEGERNDEEMPGVRDGIDPPRVVEDERNPLKEGKILQRILSNLGKHDLLNARLVSRAWNDASLEVLKNSKFTQILRGGKMERYILFATSTEPRPFILPFHLDFYICSSSMYWARYNNRVQKSGVDSLCQMFGPQCVSTLTLRTYGEHWTAETIKEIGPIECIALISPGLTTLDLKSFDAGIDFLKNQMIYFPKLKKLICNTSDCRSGRSGPGLAYISIIENSPNLEDLTLTHPCDMDSWPLNFNQLKSLTLDQIIKPQNILDKIRSSSGPPVLQELTIGLASRELWSGEEKTVVYNILESVSSTLRSLKFYGYSCDLNTGNLRFPELPRLEHFGMEYYIGNTCRLEAENIDFSPEKFPSLTSIELPFGYVFIPPPVQSEENDVARFEFPNLNKLTLRVSALVAPEDVNGTLEYLQQIFPTPSKLCLVNVGGDDLISAALYQIVKSNWSKNIQEIEMIGRGGISDVLKFNSTKPLYAL